ncbi:MAG: YhdP family protein [Burkholderiaceae bacterium]
MSLIPPVTDVAVAGPRVVRAPWWGGLRWIARALLGLVVTAWSLVLIAWLTLHWGILPHIEQWRQPIEARASAALGVPVRIGAIEVHSGGWVPAFELRDVRLLDPQGRPALRLAHVFAAVSARSLLALELRFEQVLIDAPQLEVRRDAAGRISVAGLDFSASGRDENAAADWFFAQHEFVIRGGSLRWTDAQHEAAPLVLGDVQLVVRNGLREHAMRLDATPPPEWGDRFHASGRFTQPLLARHGDWRRWSGTAYVSLPRADVRELRRHVTLPFELSEGNGALRGWFELKEGRPAAATIDLALHQVGLRLASDVEALSFAQIEGRLAVRRGIDGVTISAQHFGFVTGDQIRWPAGDLKLSWRQREGQPATGGEFSAQRLDLEPMAQIASRIPLGAALRRLLAELKPQGVVRGLTARWDGPLDAPRRYRAQAELTQLSLAGKASAEPNSIGRPGLRNADLQLDATEAGGSARIGMLGGALELPGVFDEAVVPLERLSAQLQWKVDAAPVAVRGAPLEQAAAAPKITVLVKEAHFSNPDAQGDLHATWSTGPGRGVGQDGRFPGRIELDGKLSRGVATRVPRYLPRDIDPEVRHYLDQAIQGGRLKHVGFRVKGDLWDFPYDKARNSGEFRITAQVEGAKFAFVPSVPARGAQAAYASPWPVLTDLNGELVIDRTSLEIRNARARAGAVEWSKVQGSIRNLAEDSTLNLEAAGRGPLVEMLRIVNTTPIGSWIDGALDASTATGTADLTLKLGVPLADVEATRAKGSLSLANNDLRITPASPLLAGVVGRVDFSDQGFAVVGARARVLGGEVSFEGGMQGAGPARFTGQGTLSAGGLKRAAESGPYGSVAAALTGQAAYRMSLEFVHGQPQIDLTSSLAGLAIDAPAPFNKAAETVLPLRLQTRLEPSVPGQAPRDSVRVELGTTLQAQYLRDLSGAEPRVLRGGIGVLAPTPQPSRGVAANINLKALDTEAWGPWVAGLPPADEAAQQVQGASGAAGYLPDTIALRVQELDAGSRRLTGLTAGVSREAGLWRANLDADQLNGYVEYRPPRGGVAAGRVYARLARLALPKSDADEVDRLLDQPPSSVPALDVVVEDFELRGKHLGRLEIEAVNRRRGDEREWQLGKFNLSMPEAQLVANGRWGASGEAGARRAVMDFKLQLADSGALLDRLGMPKAIKGGKGQLTGQIGWTGSPFALDYPTLTGQVGVAIEAGQFLKVEPGAARLLGVLSLQSLPRRLSLDFRDLFQEGFAFDNITGDVKIGQGVAVTNNLRMRGVQALVLMEGNADLERETQDLRVVVVPEINAGTAALAYAVINPAIGLGAFLAQAILKKPLTEAGTREFHISGPWADPKVERVERRFGDDAAVKN